MNEDMSEIFKKMNEMLKNDEVPDSVKSLLNSLSSNANDISSKEFSREGTTSENSEQNFSNFDLDTMLKMKAIIETGGKQYYVSEGATIYVEKLEGNEGDKVVFDKVLMANGVVGNPYVSSKVEGVILKQGKQKKAVTFKYKPKKGSHRKQGHSQPYTKVVINAINA